MSAAPSNRAQAPNPARLLSVAEKRHYPFRAYPKGKGAGRDLLFCGCALPSQLPRTTDALARLCRAHGMGVAYDCCGKPLADWGEDRAADRVLRGLRRRLERAGCERLVLACPNCLSYLRGRVGVPCVSVYEALLGWGDAPRVRLAPGALFVPCPDRAGRETERQVRALADLSDVATLRGVPCCGLRAEAAARGREFVDRCDARIFAAAGAGTAVYTYCASCAGQFARQGRKGVRHVLSAILGVDEEPDCRRALLNRARRRFDRALEPEDARREGDA